MARLLPRQFLRALIRASVELTCMVFVSSLLLPADTKKLDQGSANRSDRGTDSLFSVHEQSSNEGKPYRATSYVRPAMHLWNASNHQFKAAGRLAFPF
eukprot:1140520-Pelagomonas_calceolata.AAC.1